MWPFKNVISNNKITLDVIPSLCPYCGYDLKTIPQRKKKCPSCTQPFYIKYTPNNHTKRLMTEKQAKDAEDQWNLFNLRQSSISTLSIFGYGDNEIEKEIFLGAKNDNEAVFHILTRFTIFEKGLSKLKMAFLILVKLAIDTGKPFLPFKLAAQYCELLHYKTTGDVVKNIEIVISNQKNICIECQNNNGKIYDIDDALKLMPLPCSKCTCIGYGGQIGFCDCYYIAVLPKYE